MPELRISDVPATGGRGRRVEVTWQDGPARRVAVAEFGGTADDRDGELLRWYLEDYAESPADPAPALAASAEKVLASEGEALFKSVFSSPDAAGIWDRARDRLAATRVEVDADPGDGPGLAWELLRDPARDAPVALGAMAFVRTHLRAAGHPDFPEPSGDRLRVLLVICRPGGRDDVPFRSVASRLVRGGADQMAGLDLDVLRPATFARLSAVLRAARAAGRPYHVVHFDGHGDYLDVAGLGREGNGGNQAVNGGGGGFSELSPLRYGISVAGTVRPGQHGYLLFEAPDGALSGARGAGRGHNVQLVDGPTLGRLLTEAGVSVLVLNACRSAYAEARPQPSGRAEADRDEQGDGEPASTGTVIASDDGAAAEEALASDVHARIRAYGSLAAEIADAGVPGVVAMRYNVYVVTAAQFVADLYAHLLAGRSLGQAATEARRALAADPDRQIGAVPVALQDWAVPLVYESAPLVLLRTAARDAPVIRLTLDDDVRPGAADELPRPPDAGFFGRDETLLALDRAFDTQRTVLLHAFAGAGKSSTAAEFARWYEATGGLDHPDHPDLPPGPVLWLSFERHLTADRVIGQAGDYFAPLIDELHGKAWAAVTNSAQRREIVLQVLAQVPVLWIWDNVEPVAGFPAGAPSAWTQSQQGELADLLRDLAQRTRCKVLLTSRRDEQRWLGGLASRVRLPPMPMRERLQLAAALAARHGRPVAAADWRPLLRFTAGNPLTITVVTGQALRENLSTGEQLAAFVARLRAGEAPPESEEDAALGRTRSLAASLDYGFARAFANAERAQLAALHVFRDTVDVDVLCGMGHPGAADDVVPELAGLDRDTGIALLDRAAEIGLLSSHGGGYYQIHPALPWYFTTLFAATYGQASAASAQRVSRAFARAIADMGDYYSKQADSGQGEALIAVLRLEESNLLHGLDCARAHGLWRELIGCVQALRALYKRTGRDGEWARLVASITPEFTDPATGAPVPGRDSEWAFVTGYRATLAEEARDWRTATALQEALLAWYREQAEEALEVPADLLNEDQHRLIRNLGVALTELGDVLRFQGNLGCLAYYREALTLDQRIGDRQAEAQDAGSLGNIYLDQDNVMPQLRDLDEAERWFKYSLSLRAAGDLIGRAANLGSLGGVARERFRDALEARQPAPVLLKHLNDALRDLNEALDLTPADDHAARGRREGVIGDIFAAAGDVGQALPHYQRSIHHAEVRGDKFRAGVTRYNVAVLLANDGRNGEALHYARAALDNFYEVGPGAAPDAADTEHLIAVLEQRTT
jgi:tetratricopeptide (TPR) repeat protein